MKNKDEELLEKVYMVIKDYHPKRAFSVLSSLIVSILKKKGLSNDEINEVFIELGKGVLTAFPNQPKARNE